MSLAPMSKPKRRLVNQPGSAQSILMNEPNASSPGPAIMAEAPPLRFDEHEVIRVGRTRVTLDTLVAAFERGDTPEGIARNYDALSLGEVYQAIGYYLTHQAEVGTYLERREARRGAIQEQVESRHNPNGIRERLLARRRRTA